MAKKVSETAAKKTTGKTAAAAPKKTPAAKKTSSPKTPKAKTVKKAVPPAKKAPSEKAAPAKTAPAKKAPVKKAVPPAKKAPAKKAVPPAKKATPAKKTAPKKAAPAPIRKAAPPKAAPAKKTASVKPVPAPAKKAPAAKKTTKVRKDEILKKLRLSKADKKFFYGLLMHARAAFGAQVQYHSDDALTRKDAAGERAGMATHMADLGTDNYRRDFELGLLSDGVDVLEMIDEALQRLEDSEYGICLDCGEPIPRKRLEAKPYAKYCTRCKSKREEMDETFYHRR